jgi:hypothetical protein
MDLIVALVLAATFPVACLVFLLWMARFEEALPKAVRRAARRADPPPILAIPVQRAAPTAESSAPQSARAPYSADKSEQARNQAQTSEGSLSVAAPATSASLGGSTNR